MILQYCRLLFFFSKTNFSKNSFRNSVRVSNKLDPYQARRYVGSDLGPNCLQMLSADGTSRQRVKRCQKVQKGASSDRNGD